jgi:hypothetical protein
MSQDESSIHDEIVACVEQLRADITALNHTTPEAVKRELVRAVEDIEAQLGAITEA